MAIHFRNPESHDLKPRITVMGVGGAGGNAVNNMIDKALEGAEFIAANTDSQALQQSRAERRIQLGAAVTGGLGAGAQPDVGAGAADESRDEIAEALSGSNMCFITAGMGGGTGTGAAPVIAQIARDLGILTVGVVTKPFSFEGSRRMKIAEEGIDELTSYVDTLIIIPNQNLFRVADERTTFAEAFVMADDVLYQGVKGVTDLMVRPGMVNLDFADVRAVMNEMGKAMMGSGEASGEGRALEAAEKAIANPLLDDITLEGARGVLINITGGHDLTLFEVDEAANRIRNEADPDANVIFGSALDPEMDGKVRVSVVATGIEAEAFYEYEDDRRDERRDGGREPARGGRREAGAQRRFGVDPVDAHIRRARSAARPDAARAGSPAVTTFRGMAAERRFGDENEGGGPQAYRDREETSRAPLETVEPVAPASLEIEALPHEPSVSSETASDLSQAPAHAAAPAEPEVAAEPSPPQAASPATAEPAVEPTPSRPEPAEEAAFDQEPRATASEASATEPSREDQGRAEPTMGPLGEMVRKIADADLRAQPKSAEAGGRVQIPSFLRR